LLLAGAVLIVILLVFSGGSGLQETRSPVAGGGSETVVEGVRVVATESGRILWRLNTGRAVVPDKGDVARLGPVEVDVPSEDLRVRAGSGQYHLESNDLELSDGVQAYSGGLTLVTKEARLYSGSGEVVSDSPVVVDGEGFTVRGRGLRADGHEVRILGDVSAEVR
jgi:LPS export ABC transporter protein LptC